MNHLPEPPNERELPNQHRRRAELLGAIGGRPESSRRRVLVPLVAAASVVALFGGGTLAAQQLQGGPAQGTSNTSASQPTPDESEGNATSGTAKPDKGQEGAASGASPEPPPEAHEMTPEEQKTALQKCTTDGLNWRQFEPILGIRFEVGAEWGGQRTSETEDGTKAFLPGPATSYLLARDETSRVVCTFDRDGHSLSWSRFGSSEAKSIPYLFAPVDGKGDGFGRYTGDVAKVTLQKKGGPERTAVTRNGYYFLPIDFHGSADGPAGSSGYVRRGYDESGQLVYSSKEHAPIRTGCYTDPDGEEVLVHNGVDGGNPDPEDCRRTLEWNRP